MMEEIIMRNIFDISGKIAVVTGASSGLGRAYAKMLAEEGAGEVILVGRREERLLDLRDKIQKETQAKAIALPCDVGNAQEVLEKFSTLSHVDILINNAGITEKSKDFTEMTEDQWHDVIEVNLSGIYRVSREVCKLMKRQKYGKIINISSIFALMGASNQIGYCAAKGGIVSLTRAMAVEMAPYNITVNAILPGYCESEMTDLKSGGCRYFASRTPLGRIGKADDLFGTILLLASDASKWMTGCVITVDGGHTANL